MKKDKIKSSIIVYYSIRWDKEPYKTKYGNVIVPVGWYETADRAIAEKVKAEKEAAGFKNVRMGIGSVIHNRD